jgi:beta-lactamase regulating signal transducer with metallopeptidase domain
MMDLAALEAVAITWFALLLPAALEAAVLGGLLCLLVRARFITSSSLGHALLFLALVKFIAPPVPAPWAVPVELPAALAAVGEGALMNRSTTADHLLPITPSGSQPAHQFGARAGATPVATATGQGTKRPSRRAVATGQQPMVAPTGPSPDGGAAAAGSTVSGFSWASGGVLAALLLVQLAGAATLVLRRVGQMAALQRILARAYPVNDTAVLAALRSVCVRQRVRRQPVLLASPDNVGPAATGLWRRRIVVPERMLSEASPTELRAVIAHEVAHHRRADLWVDFVGFLGGLVWWPHPIYWLVRRELLRLREDCCDDAAVLEVGGARRYCQSLLDAAAVVGTPRPALPAVAHGSFTHPLGRRIRRLMNPNLKPAMKLSVLGVATFAIVAVLVVPAATTQGAPLRATAATEPPPGAQEIASLPPAGPLVTAPTLPTAANVPSAPQEKSRSRWSFSNWGTGGDDVSLGIDDGNNTISDGAIDALVKKGLDRQFLEGLDGTPDRDLSLDELRGWSRYGLEADLPDALAGAGVAEVRVIDVLLLVWVDATAGYVRSLTGAGLDELDVDEIVRLARYEVAGGYIADFRAAGYADLSVDDLVRLHRYEVAPSYAGTYREAGYDLSVDDMVRLSRYEVDEHAVARLAAAGIGQQSVDDLVRLSRYSVTDDYIREITEDGQVDVSTDDLIRLRRYEVGAAYARAMRATGIAVSTDDLIRLKRYEVSADLVQELANLNYDVSTDDMVRLNRYEVSLDYIRALRTLGYTSPSVDDLITLQRYGVDTARIQALADAGYAALPVSDVVRLQRYEVGPGFIRAMAAVGGRQYSVDELITLRRYEVAADYVGAMNDTGLGALSVDDLVLLKRNEVSPEFVTQLHDAGFDDLDVDGVIRMSRARR